MRVVSIQTVRNDTCDTVHAVNAYTVPLHPQNLSRSSTGHQSTGRQSHEEHSPDTIFRRGSSQLLTGHQSTGHQSVRRLESVRRPKFCRPTCRSTEIEQNSSIWSRATQENIDTPTCSPTCVNTCTLTSARMCTGTINTEYT